jgi:NADH:ubiquinone oxidoreductase subunit 6 (subunit J)
LGSFTVSRFTLATLAILALAPAAVVAGIALVVLAGWGWDDVLVLALGFILVASGLAVVTLRDIIRCGLALIVCFASLAGLYVILGAPLLAAAQVLIYIGAIAVLILFAIMVTQTKAGPARLVFQRQAVVAALASVVVAFILAVAAAATNWGAGSERTPTPTPALAATVFRDYLLPFEVVGVLLLAAVVGGVFLARRDDGGRP